MKGKIVQRPKAVLVAIGNAFEHASEAHPVEALLSYNAQRKILDYLGYDDNSESHLWDEEAIDFKGCSNKKRKTGQ